MALNLDAAATPGDRADQPRFSTLTAGPVFTSQPFQPAWLISIALGPRIRIFPGAVRVQDLALSIRVMVTLTVSLAM
jgi:hypothetical protein